MGEAELRCESGAEFYCIREITKWEVCDEGRSKGLIAGGSRKQKPWGCDESQHPEQWRCTGHGYCCMATPVSSRQPLLGDGAGTERWGSNLLPYMWRKGPCLEVEVSRGSPGGGGQPGASVSQLGNGTGRSHQRSSSREKSTLGCAVLKY